MPNHVGIILNSCIFYLCFYVMLVESDNGTQHRNPGTESNSVKLTNLEKKSTIPGFNSTGWNPEKISAGKIKNNTTAGKVPFSKGIPTKFLRSKKEKNQPLVKGKKSHVLEKSSASKKGNTTISNKMETTKASLRMGNQNKWPKVQPRRLRNKPLKDSKRFTKMNLMQMEEQSTIAPNQIQALGEDKSEYLSPYTLHQHMIGMARRFPDANVSVEVIGRTIEYNDIVLLKISQGFNDSTRFRSNDMKYVDDTNEKKIIFIVHGLSVMGIFGISCLAKEKDFEKLVSYYLKHLDKFDIFLVPMANPDGYGYMRENWNKNLSPQDACPGVALDRNFDIEWNSSRAISSCSQQYPGPEPFSEPESRAIRDVLHRYAHKIISYIHVHAGMYNAEVFKGDAVLYPKGYTDVQTDDDKYIDLKSEIEEAMRKANFHVYSVSVDSLHNWYGRVSGTSVDYASSVYGIPYSMEFVMQLYEDNNAWTKSDTERTDYLVLVEVWSRVIDVVANSIWNSFHSNEV